MKDKEINDLIEQLNTLVDSYQGLDLQNGDGINDLMQDFSTVLYYMGVIEYELRYSYSKRVKDLVDKGESVASAERIADTENKNLFRIKPRMKRGIDVLNAMRSNLSYLKSERNQN